MNTTSEIDSAMNLFGELYIEIQTIAVRAFPDNVDDAYACIGRLTEVVRKKSHAILHHNNPRAWMLSALHKCILKQQRQSRSLPTIIGLDTIIDNLSFSDESVYNEDTDIDDKKIELAKEHVISRLTDVERETFDLVFVQKIPRKDAAEKLGISVPTLNVRVSRLRLKIETYVRNVF